MTERRDAVVPFSFELLPVRGEIIQLRRAWQRMQLGHDYATPVRETLGHAAAAAGLIAQSLNFDGTITLQISGNGPLSMLVMQCTSELELRGMASADDGLDAASFGQLVTGARCAITVDAGQMERPYQGIVEVLGDSLSASLENYYLRSAQVPSHLRLVADQSLCGGILLQQVPGKREPEPDDWHRLGLLAATLRESDFVDGVGPGLLGRLFAEDDIRIYQPRPAIFRCRCSKRRAQQVLKLLGEAESRDACEELGKVEVTCEYCGRTRSFDAVDISSLFAGQTPAGSDALH